MHIWWLDDYVQTERFYLGMKRVWISGWLFVPTSSLHTSEPAAISLEPLAANSSEPPAAIHRSLRPPFIGTSGRRFFEIFDRRSLEPPAVVRRSLRPSFMGASGQSFLPHTKKFPGDGCQFSYFTWTIQSLFGLRSLGKWCKWTPFFRPAGTTNGGASPHDDFSIFYFCGLCFL